MIIDGRNLDPRIADMHGEGATIAVDRPDVAWPVPPEAHPAAVSETYYDLPVIKTPPWKWFVPSYFYAGGLAGAAATIGEHAIALAAESIGGALLIADLGKPLRFINMMRVFRPTSPMNMGTWILGTAGASTALALVTGWRPARVTSAIAGSMLSTYTGVLIGNTAVPVWHATRRRMPLYFAASSAASLASLLELLGRPRHRYAVVAKTANLATMLAVQAKADAAGVGAPLHEGRAGTMWRGAKWLGIASLAATVLSRPRLAGVLGTAAAVLGRFAIAEAGVQSAADPRATFGPQRT